MASHTLLCFHSGGYQVPSLLRTEPQSGPSGDKPVKLEKGVFGQLKSALIADSNLSNSTGAAHAAANLLCWFTLVPCRVRKPLTLMQVGGGASALPVCPVPPILDCSLFLRSLLTKGKKGSVVFICSEALKSHCDPVFKNKFRVFFF